MNRQFYVLALTAAALVAFAANSILCRMALGGGLIDPAGFTTTRLVSGAVVLWAVASITSGAKNNSHGGSWASAARPSARR